MPTSPLHGLNLVAPDSPSDPISSREILSAEHFRQLSDQLELWSTLNFQSDDRGNGPSPGGDDKDDDEGEPDRPGPAPLEGHVNAVNPSPTITNAESAAAAAHNEQMHQQPQQMAFPPLQQPGMDMNSILASFGIDPYLVPQVPAPAPVSAQSAASASLAQLLAAYPFAHPPFLPQLQTQDAQIVAPSVLSTAPSTSSADAHARKARSRKTSTVGDVSVFDDSAPPSPISPSISLPTPPSSMSPPASASSGQNVTPAEDKRRRNTAASARFRMKKKEREAALEKKAAELEMRVGALERECEGLRRENGWLKGLVVGVTGASSGTVVSPQQLQQLTAGAGAPPSPPAPAAKRKRDEVEVA